MIWSVQYKEIKYTGILFEKHFTKLIWAASILLAPRDRKGNYHEGLDLLEKS